MDRKRQTLIARIGFIIYLGALAWLCFGSFDSLPDVQQKFFGIDTDKIVHFIMFLPFPFLMFSSFEILPCKAWKYILFILLSFAVGCATGAATEFIQGFTMNRVTDIKDFYADVAGCATSAVATFLIYLKHASK